MSSTRVLYTVPVGIREAVEAEARRLGVTPSRVVATFFTEKLPEFIAERVASTIEQSVRDGLGEHQFSMTVEREQAEIDRRTTSDRPAKRDVTKKRSR